MPFRDPAVLRDFSTVNLGTVNLGNRVWTAFQKWLSQELSPGAVHSLPLQAELLGLLATEFGKYLYESGQSIYLLRHWSLISREPILLNDLICTVLGTYFLNGNRWNPQYIALHFHL